MNCQEAQKKYIPFIDDKLSPKDLEEFLKHMDECQDCREEYDIYYTMIMGTRYLESDVTKGSNWVNSNEKLEFAQDYLKKYKILRIEKIVLFILLCIGIISLYC